LAARRRTRKVIRYQKGYCVTP